MRSHRLTFLSTMALVLGIGASAFGQAEKYVRFKHGETQRDAALQTAVAHFTHPDSKVEIVLYGVVHIADKAYYKAVQKDLDSYSVVLYEGVAPGKTKPTAQDKSLGNMQKMMGELLGLSFQKDGIDYKRKNLVHADMNMDQLKKALGGNSLNPMGGMVGKDQMKQLAPMMKMISQFGKMFMERMPQMRDRFKLMMGKQLGTANLNKAMPGNFGKVILIDRNKVVMKVLAKQLEKTKSGTVAIFYGAAHNPDFQQRLGKLGWKVKSKRWMTAWQIGKGVKAEGTLKPIRPRTGTTVKAGKKKTPAKTEEKAEPKTKQRWF